MAPIEHDENAVAAYTLHKTIVFMLYGLLVFLFAGFPVLLAQDAKYITPKAGNILYVLSEFICLSILLYLIIKGYLPGSKDQFIQPFSERQIATACMILAIGSWVFAGSTEQGKIIRTVVSGALVLCCAVYFLTKSVLSKSMRWEVLLVLLVPALELWFTINAP